MKTLSLFAGIGGLDLGLERAGVSVVAQVERDSYRRRILARHWPDADRHDDVRTIRGWWVSRPRPRIDVVCGGFPCQPFSGAGHRKGTQDDRWGWPWMLDAVRLVRPRYVIVENVATLLADRLAFGTILAGLADLGMDVCWSVLSACAVGAPHTRERLFIVAYPHGEDGPKWLGTAAARHAVREKDGRQAAWAEDVDRSMAAPARGDGDPDGVSAGMDARRIAALGDAVVPDVAERVGSGAFFMTPVRPGHPALSVPLPGGGTPEQPNKRQLSMDT